MKKIADANGFHQAITLINEEAKIRVVRNHIKWAAHLLLPGDVFMLSCSSHGSQRTDRNRDEPDGRDETLCLWDGQWIDDDRLDLFTRFAKGVRILFIVDACHSASTARVLQAEAGLSGAAEIERERPRSIGGEPQVGRNIQTAEANVQDALIGIKGSESLKKFKEMLANDNEVPRDLDKDFGAQFNLSDDLTSPIRALPDRLSAYLSQFPSKQDDAPPKAKSLQKMRAGVFTMSACQDTEFAWDTGSEGVFTRALRDIWNGGEFEGTYSTFFEAVAQPLKRIGKQHPAKDVFGNTGDFLSQKPFTVE